MRISVVFQFVGLWVGGENISVPKDLFREGVLGTQMDSGISITFQSISVSFLSLSDQSNRKSKSTGKKRNKMLYLPNVSPVSS